MSSGTQKVSNARHPYLRILFPFLKCKMIFVIITSMPLFSDMIKTADHAQIFLDYLIENHRFYLDISLSQKRSLKNELSANWFLTKRNPIIRKWFLRISELDLLLNVPIPMIIFEPLLDSISSISLFIT